MFNGLAITLSGSDEAQAASVAALEALPQVIFYAIDHAILCRSARPPRQALRLGEHTMTR